MGWVDWKLILTSGTIILNIIVLVTIKFNDLSHLSRAVKSNSDKLDKLDDRVDKLGERVATVEGKLEK